MLKRFEVENYKGFRDRLVLDMSAGKCAFNPELVRNGMVKNALIYGKNGIGKTTLGIALFDIILHLTDKHSFDDRVLQPYCNLDSRPDEPVMFRYVFEFDGEEIVYEYAKTSPSELVYERLWFGRRKVLNVIFPGNAAVDTRTHRNRLSKDAFGATIRLNLTDNRLSAVKYLARNLPTGTSPQLTQLISFCDNMLWYRALSGGDVSYAGFMNGPQDLSETIRQMDLLGELNLFLQSVDLNYSLNFRDINGKPQLYAEFAHGNGVPFRQIASTGTMSLVRFFVWQHVIRNRASLLFIDEFDAFVHYEAAARLLNEMKQSDCQIAVTTHNTHLMQNRLTRPDCCFIMTHNRITNLASATDKEIREAHNLEKMYINGVFSEIGE